MTTITWAVDWMETSTQTINGHSEVVLTAGWSCSGIYGMDTETGIPQARAYISGSCSFPAPAAGGSFTPYSSLTQEQVLGWCWADGVDKTETEVAVQTQIDNQLNPPVVTPPLPWAQGA